MATTPTGLPYPVGTDKVVDGDNAIRALAEAVEPRFGRYLGQALNPAQVILPAAPAFAITQAMSITPRRGVVYVHMNISITNANSGGGRTATIQLWRDGNAIGSFPQYCPLDASNTNPVYSVHWLWAVGVTPNVATTFTIMGYGSVASALLISANACNIAVSETP